MNRKLSLLLALALLVSLLAVPSLGGAEFFEEETFSEDAFLEDGFDELPFEESFDAFEDAVFDDAGLFGDEGAFSEADEALTEDALPADDGEAEEAAEAAELAEAAEETEGEAPAEAAEEVSEAPAEEAETEETEAEEAEAEAEEDAPVTGFASIPAGTVIFADAQMETPVLTLAEDAVVYIAAVQSIPVGDEAYIDVAGIEYLSGEETAAGFILASAAALIEPEGEEEIALTAVTPLLLETEEDFGLELESRAAPISDLVVVPGMSTSDGSTGTVRVRWTPSTASDAAGYRVRYSTAQNDLASSTCAYEDGYTAYTDDDGKKKCYVDIPNLQCGDTYYFAVFILDSNVPANVITQSSNVVSWTVSPNAPTDLTASSVEGQTKAVKLQWNAVTGATGYVVYRGNTFVAKLNSDSKLDYTDTASSLKVGSTYTYRVYTYIYKGTKNDPDSNPVSPKSANKKDYVVSSQYATVEYTLKPGTPTDAKATSVSTTSIKVSWTPVTNVSGYRVYYQLGKDTVSTSSNYVDVTGAKASSVTITDLSPMLEYSFMVCSYVSGATIYDEEGEAIGTEPESFSDTTSIFSHKALPGVVKNVKATYSNDTKKVTLTWAAATETLTGYRIYWDTNKDFSSPATEVDIAQSQTTYTIDATVGTTYYFKVVGRYDSNVGSQADADLVWVTAFPDQPKSFTAVNGALTSDGKGSADLAWDPVVDAKGYIIERSTKNTFAATATATVATVDASTLNYNDSPLTIGTTYYYRVYAYVEDPNGNKVKGPASEVVSLKGAPSEAIFDDVTVLDARTQYCGIKATWFAVDGADGYYVSLIDTYTGKTIVSNKKLAGNGNTSYSFTGLTAGEPYDVIVKSYKGSGTSAGVSWVDNGNDPVVPPIYVPDSLTISSVNPTSVKVSWSKVFGVKGYHVHVEADASGTLIDTTFTALDADTTATSYTITGMKTGYPYIVRVSSYSDAQGTTLYTKDSDGSDPLDGYVGDVTEVMPAPWTEEVVKAVPATPASLKAAIKYNASNEPYVQLTWNAVTDLTNGGYILTRTIDGTTKEFTCDDNAYQDTDIDETMIGKTITYYVQSYIDPISEGPTGYTLSNKSNTASVVLSVAKPELTMTNDSDGTILVTWKKVWGATGYEVYRATSKSFAKATLLKNISDPSTTEYEDTDSDGFKVGKAYYYYVKALDAGTVSAVGTGKRSGPPPTNMVVSQDADGNDKIYARTVYLEWKAPTGATPAGYIVYASKDQGETWSKLGTTGKKVTKYTAKKLVFQQDYTFAVVAKYAGSSTSMKCILNDDPTATVTTKLTEVKNLKAVNTNTSAISWTKVPDATGYKLVVIDPSASSTGVSVYSTTSNKYTLKGLVAAKQYDVYVYPYIKYDGVVYPTSKLNDQDPNNWSSELADYAATVANTKAYVGPKATGSISVSGLTSSSAYISWKAVSVSNQAMKYKVEYKVNGADDSTYTTITSDTTQRYAQVSGLTAKTKYVFRVTPFYEDSGETYMGASKTKTATTKK